MNDDSRFRHPQESAAELFYEQGVHPTTLADVAERADVPLGNVYYY
jgi:TetR/AcrR family transcriptional regulator, transcriptional repressor for nem operon